MTVSRKIEAGAALVSAVAAAFVLLAACGGGPDAAACKAGLEKQFSHALTHPSATTPPEPAACHGLGYRERQRIVGEILNGD